MLSHIHILQVMQVHCHILYRLRCSAIVDMNGLFIFLWPQLVMLVRIVNFHR